MSGFVVYQAEWIGDMTFPVISVELSPAEAEAIVQGCTIFQQQHATEEVPSHIVDINGCNNSVWMQIYTAGFVANSCS